MPELYLPDAGQWINALEAGQQAGMTDRKNRAAAQAGGLMAAGDYAGAARQFYDVGDIASGSALAKAGFDQQDRATKLARQQAVRAKLDAGDLGGAYAEAGADEELLGGLNRISEHTRETTALMASALQALKTPDGQWLPPEVARAKYAEMKPQLQARGLSAQQLDAFDPTPENLTAIQPLEFYMPKVVGKSLVRPTGEVVYRDPEYREVGPGQQLVEIGGGGQGSSPTGDASLPRGLRNNNPLNLEATVNWNGMTGSDGRYAVFSSPEAGWAAADKNLQTYATKHGIDTVAGIVNRWAPPSENDSGAYAATVARRVGVAPNARLNLADPGVRRQVLEAMAEVENGKAVGYGGGADRLQGGPSGDRVRVVAQGAPKPSARPATPQEKAAYGIPADVPAQIDADGKLDVISGVAARAKPPPVKIQTGYVENNAAIAQIDAAIELLRQRPDAMGMFNMLGDEVRQRTDPNGIRVRAAVAQVGAVKVHDLSGAAVTAAETPRLKPFIPMPTDTAAAAIQKLLQLRQDVVNKNAQMEIAFGEHNGFQPLGDGRPQGGRARNLDKYTPAQRQAIKQFGQRTNDPPGQKANPFVPTSQGEFDKLPPDAWFINPADGRLLQKAH